MVDLSQAVEALVRMATSEADPRALRPTVEKVLDAFDNSPPNVRNAALRSIGKALPKVDGRGAQILCLALGALVEAGATPELAWPAIAFDLAPLLEHATAFARAVVREAKEEEVETALEKAGAAVAKKKPRQAQAWRALPSRCLAAVACLTRSKKLRANVRKEDTLVEAAWPLSDVVAEVGNLLQALRIADDTSLVVLAPAVGKGWRIAIDSMPSNLELYILLADALLGDPKKGRLPGKRPDAKAVAAMLAGSEAKKAAPFTVPFQLLAWTAVEADGTLPDPTSHDHWIWAEGVPADIPPFGDERIVLLQDVADGRPLPVAASYEALRPKLTVVSELSASDVTRTMVKLATTAGRSAKSAKAAAAKKKRARVTKRSNVTAKPAKKKTASAKKKKKK